MATLSPLLSLGAVLALAFGALAPSTRADTSLRATTEDAPPLGRTGAALVWYGDQVIAAGGVSSSGPPALDVVAWKPGAGTWQTVATLPGPARHAALVVAQAQSLWLLGGTDSPRGVLRLEPAASGWQVTPLPDLPVPAAQPSATQLAGWVYVTSDEGLYRASVSAVPPVWEAVSGAPVDLPTASHLASAFDRLVIISNLGPGWSYHASSGWRTTAPPPAGARVASTTSLGESHVLALLETVTGGQIGGYHVLTDTWTTYAIDGPAPVLGHLIGTGAEVRLLDAATVQHLSVVPPTLRYGTIDHVIVALYLAAMLGMGVYFVRREKGGSGFFSGGHRLPWWALGMSLFATGASAISLMTMPGKSYSGDWTYFFISIAAVICLPLSVYLVAPLVRKLGITTSGEYLERRFGYTARVVGSTIYSTNQVLGRMAPILFLPSLALAAITGVDVWIWIVGIGVVTTLYTFMGGLAAVVWTDTVQGFVMVLTVTACLVLLLLQLNGSPAEWWAQLASADKTRVFDWRWDITLPTSWLILISTVFISLGGIGDQNYVQRVQAAKSLRETRLAVATQLGVAVPLNALLFGLGSLLYLYYRQHPVQVDPLGKADAVYPFFAAQHLPPGLAGLVVAALLAASMSTVSSAMCSVANLGVDDFLRRLRPRTTDREALVVGRWLTVTVGGLGIGGALYLATTDSKSIWDLALAISGLILNGIVGFFGLGLLTRRAHEIGALIGVAAGMGFTFWLQNGTPINFWLYSPLGSAVTFAVGYLASMLIPWPRKDLVGLTMYTLGRRNAP